MGTATSADAVSEIWRDIPGWEGFYQASSLGRVRSVPRLVRTSHGQRRRRCGKVLNTVASGGYLTVGLCRDGIRQPPIGVHRLVCLAFHGPAPETGERMLTAHNDGTRDNNRPENLRWATYTENMEDRRKHGTAGGGWTISEETAREIKRRLANGERQKAIYTDLGLKKWTVQHIARGLSWSLI